MIAEAGGSILANRLDCRTSRRRVVVMVVFLFVLTGDACRNRADIRDF
jgi:hypothetical protein